MNGELLFRIIFLSLWIVFVAYIFNKQYYYTREESTSKFSMRKHLREVSKREGKVRIAARAVLTPFWIHLLCDLPRLDDAFCYSIACLASLGRSRLLDCSPCLGGLGLPYAWKGVDSSEIAIEERACSGYNWAIPLYQTSNLCSGLFVHDRLGCRHSQLACHTANVRRCRTAICANRQGRGHAD